MLQGANLQSPAGKQPRNLRGGPEEGRAWRKSSRSLHEMCFPGCSNGIWRVPTWKSICHGWFCQRA
eukprot:12326520-Prorocentrum_lima.AAC.1